MLPCNDPTIWQCDTPNDQFHFFRSLACIREAVVLASFIAHVHLVIAHRLLTLGGDIMEGQKDDWAL